MNIIKYIHSSKGDNVSNCKVCTEAQYYTSYNIANSNVQCDNNEA